MARMSAAYAELVPDEESTLPQAPHQSKSSYRQISWTGYQAETSSSPDKNRLLDTKSPRIQLPSQDPLPPLHHPLICQDMPEWISSEYNKIRRKLRGVRFEVEDLGG